MLEDCKIILNTRYKGDYFNILFDAPKISPNCKPGQFVHVKIEGLRDKILRRPFSINDTFDGKIKILYKVVGDGTKFLSMLPLETVCNLMGPRGNGFTVNKDKIPVIITGGYGAAATFMLAKQSPQKGFLLAGAKTENDLILIEDYKKNGFKTITSTDDGSSGTKGFVTFLLEKFISEKKDNLANFAFYACGPEAMSYAVAKLLLSNGLNGEISLDHKMCCGVGACLACVLRLKKDGGGWKYSRTCVDGPVFKASSLFLD